MWNIVHVKLFSGSVIKLSEYWVGPWKIKRTFTGESFFVFYFRVGVSIISLFLISWNLEQGVLLL